MMPTLRLVGTLLGLIALAALLWWIGPLIAIGTVQPLASATVRALLIALLFIGWALRLAWQLGRARRQEQALAEGLSSAGPSADLTMAQSLAEAQLQQERLRNALGLLRQHRRRGLGSLPWYVLIGPPGAGKTTALRNAGLHFPLAEQHGEQALEGVGGTRHCDWWFTEEAVWIDTAGRYTTQDSHASVDSAAWRGFLGLLRRHRPRRPLNGLVVALGLDDLLNPDATQRQAHARAIQQRIREVDAQLGLRMPVYLLLTKADRLPGFTEFYAPLSAEEREQVWGLGFAADETDAPARFDALYSALAERLNQRLLARLASENEVQQRARLLGFVQAVAGLQPALGDFVRSLCQPSRLHEPVWLRGLYLSSATQGAASNGEASAGRSHFLGGFLRQVVLAEAELVGYNRRAETRRRWAYALGCSTAALAVAVGGALWWQAQAHSRATIAQLAERLHEVPAVVQTGPGTEWTGLLPHLDALRALADTPAPTPTWGLRHAQALQAAAQQAYQRELQQWLAPRLASALASALQASRHDTDPTYATLKGYLMLGQPEHRDPAYLQALLQTLWDSALPEQPAASAALQRHLAAWLSAGAPALPLQSSLVAEARATLARVPLAELAYSRLKREALAHDSAPLRLREVLGSSAAGFERRSGLPVEQATLPGLYTARGQAEVFVPQRLRLAQALRDDAWVFGDGGDGGPARGPATARELATLADDVGRLYAADYIQAWQALLADLRPAPLRNPAQALNVLAALSGRESGLRKLLRAVDEHTRPAAGAGAQAQLAARLTDGFQRAKDELSQVLKTAAPTALPTAGAAAAAPRIDSAFAELQASVRADAAGNAPLDPAIDQLGALYAELNSLLNPPAAANPAADPAAAPAPAVPSDSPAARRLTQLALAQPQPVREWLLQTATSSGALIQRQQASAQQQQRGEAGKALRAQIDSAWKNDVLPFCQAAVAQRYPFDKRSNADLPLKDFARLYAPGGLIDSFVKARLAPFIDSSRSPWRWRASAERIELGAPNEALRALEIAARVRDAFFPSAPAAAGNPGLPAVEFAVRALPFERGLQRVSLSHGGEAWLDRGNPGQFKPVRWPSNDGAATLSLAEAFGRPEQRSSEGPWAWWRLLDQATLERSAPDRVLATWRAGNHSVQIELRADSVQHPFQPLGLEQFQCPKGF